MLTYFNTLFKFNFMDLDCYNILIFHKLPTNTQNHILKFKRRIYFNLDV